MATERLIIEVREKGAQQAAKNVAGIGAGAQTSAKGVDLLKRALLALGGAAAVRELVSLLDTFTNIQNRLRLVTKSTAELNVVTKELFAISKRTRTGFEGTATVFSRVALAAKDLGVSNKQTLEFTESLNQAVILSGVSAQEAQAGLIQLSQGLASNRLSGDELRSVLEQLPFVADVIARQLGVTRGELRKMGEDGKITAKIVLDAFKNAREELAERFAKTVPTVSQAFAVLKNNVIELIGALDSNVGIAGILAQTILALANNVGTLARLLGAAGLLGIIIALQAGFARLTVAARAFTAALVANPVGALIKALVVVISLLISFSDKIRFGGEGATTLADIFVATFNIISRVISSASAFIAGFISRLSGIGVSLETLKTFVVTTFTTFVKIIDGTLGVIAGSFVGLVRGLQFIPGAFKDLFIQAFNGVIGIVEKSINFILEKLNVVLEFAGLDTIGLVSIDRIENTAAGTFNRLGSVMKESILAGLDVRLIERTLAAIGTEAQGVTQERLGSEIVKKASEEFALSQLGQAGQDVTKAATDTTKKGKSFADIKRELEQENALLQLNSQERERQAAIFSAEEALKRKLTEAEKQELTGLLLVNDALAARADILDEIQAPQLELARGQQALNSLFSDGAITVEQYNQKLRELQLAAFQTDTTIEGGLRRGLLSIGQEFTNLSTLAESTLVNAFKGAEDALVEFAQTGKLSVKDLVDSIFNDLTRLAVRSAITGPIAGFLSGQATGGQPGGGGGFLAGLGGLASSFFGGGGGTGGAVAAGAAAGGSTGAQAGLLASISGLFGFRDGGSFTVGGSGGPDSQFVGFKASPGEEVVINKPGQGGGRQVNVVFNISTPDADSFQRSQGQILAKTQASLSRANARNN